jgi:hypothetical protein
MKAQNPPLMIGLISLSILTSFWLVYYGMNIIMSGKAHEIMIFAYVTTAYGLANIAILSVAWSSRDAWASGASKFIALCYLGVYIMDTINSGMKSSMEVFGVLILAVVLGVNWFAVRMVIERP